MRKVSASPDPVLSALREDMDLLQTNSAIPHGSGWLILAAFVVISAAGCSRNNSRPPVENPAPTRFVRVHGSVDPTLALKVGVRHFTAAEGCRHATPLLRRLDGEQGPPQMREIDVPVMRTEGGRYEALVPLDRLEPGECGWHPFVIAIQVENASGLSTGEFRREGDRMRLQPAGQGVVWIDSAVRRARVRTGPLPPGTLEVQPVELQCRPHTLRGAQSLSCVTPRPGALTVIAEQAEAVEVNLRDLSQMRGPG